MDSLEVWVEDLDGLLLQVQLKYLMLAVEAIISFTKVVS